MKTYLFFDIECMQVNGENYPFSFGYVRTTDTFEIIDRHDILMRPVVNYRLDQSGVRVHYSRTEIDQAPSFADRYLLLKSILETPDSVIFGHAIDNDIQFLQDACIRDGLEGFQFDYYDTQLLYATVMQRQEQSALDRIMSEHRVPMLNAHKSDIDAYYTMMTARLLEQLQGISVRVLLRTHDFWPGRMDGVTARPVACAEWFTPVFRIRPIQMMLWQYLVNRDPRITGRLTGKGFCFNTSSIWSDMPRMIALLQRIFELGGFYTEELDEIDYFLHDYAPCHIQSLCERATDWTGELMSLKELTRLVGLSEPPTMNLSEIKDYFLGLDLV